MKMLNLNEFEESLVRLISHKFLSVRNYSISFKFDIFIARCQGVSFFTGHSVEFRFVVQHVVKKTKQDMKYISSSSCCPSV